MHKSLLVVIVSTVFVFSAAAQLNTDTLQNKIKPFSALTDSTLPKPLFLASVIPANFYTTHLPFFCDKELKLQKAIKIPLIFRVGSVVDCNKLEGKY